MQALSNESAGTVHGVTNKEVKRLRKIMGAMEPSSRERSTSSKSSFPSNSDVHGQRNRHNHMDSTPGRNTRSPPADAGTPAFCCLVPPTPIFCCLPLPFSIGQCGHTGNTPILYPPLCADDRDAMSIDEETPPAAQKSLPLFYNTPAPSPTPQFPPAPHTLLDSRLGNKQGPSPDNGSRKWQRQSTDESRNSSNGLEQKRKTRKSRVDTSRTTNSDETLAVTPVAKNRTSQEDLN